MKHIIAIIATVALLAACSGGGFEFNEGDVREWGTSHGMNADDLVDITREICDPDETSDMEFSMIRSLMNDADDGDMREEGVRIACPGRFD